MRIKDIYNDKTNTGDPDNKSAAVLQRCLVENYKRLLKALKETLNEQRDDYPHQLEAQHSKPKTWYP